MNTYYLIVFGNLTILINSFLIIVNSVSCQTIDLLEAKLKSQNNRLKPEDTLKLLNEIQKLSPTFSNRNGTACLVDLIKFSKNDLNSCNLDYFMDIKLLIENDNYKLMPNLISFLKFYRNKQYSICKLDFEQSLKKLNRQDIININNLRDLIVKANPKDVNFTTLAIPPKNIPIGVANYLKSTIPIEQKNELKDPFVVESMLVTIGELCGRIVLNFNHFFQFHKIDNISYREIFGQEKDLDQFIWQWLLNMQICRDMADDLTVMGQVFDLVSN